MFNPSILELESQIQYHQEQQELAEQELDRLKMTQAFAEDAAEKVEDALEHIDPKYVDVFREHLLALFPTEAPIYLEEKVEEVIESQEVKKEKEFGPLSYYELTGKPDTRPDTYEDLAPNITYSSSGRAYVGFHDREEAEEFRDSISEPSMLSDTDTMNGYKYEVKFYCNRGYIKELQQELENDWTPEQKAELDWQEQLVRIAPDIFYDPSEEVCYLGFKAKGRADNYGSYLTRILDIAEKYVVVNKPRATTNTKYELKLETIAEEDAKYLSKFNLKKEYDDSKNKDARELWRTPLRSVHPESWMIFVVRASEVYRAKFTRFDVRVDDYKRRVKLKKLVKLAKSGDVARVQQFMHIEAGAIGQKDTISTVYFGSKRRQLIIHNAEFLHDLKCDRWEARFREVRAKECVRYIINNFDVDSSKNILVQINNVLRYLGNKALKIVDFIKRKGDKAQGIKRYRRYNFFTSLLKDIGELDLLPPIRDPKLNAIEFIQKSFNWFNRQVFKRFALLEQIFKTNFPYIIQLCMNIASERFDNEDLRWYEKMMRYFII